MLCSFPQTAGKGHEEIVHGSSCNSQPFKNIAIIFLVRPIKLEVKKLTFKAMEQCTGHVQLKNLKIPIVSI